MKVESFKRKYIQMLATLLATATYAVGFNPPGGVWQDSAGHLPGDPIMRSTGHHRYMVFFYFNAAAFTLSVMVVVVTLFLAACHKKIGPSLEKPLLVLMVMAIAAFMAAYVAGACRNRFMMIVFAVMASFPGVVLRCSCCCLYIPTDEEGLKDRAKLSAPLSMFALTLSYVGGLTTPGGFWDSAEGGHRSGDTILHGKLLRLFSFFNTWQFVSSLYCVLGVMISGVNAPSTAFGMSIGLLGLIVAYTAGSSRGRHGTVGVICSLCAAVVAYAMVHVAVRWRFRKLPATGTGSSINSAQEDVTTGETGSRNSSIKSDEEDVTGHTGSSNTIKSDEEDVIGERQRRRASNLVQLLSGLSVSITYQAGMYPPGGVWQSGDKAGDPILFTTNPGRYRAFYYCNSVAFVASLIAILLGQKRYLTKHHALQAAMILNLLALMVAYAIGSCRDQISSMYILGIAAATVVYVVAHIQYFTLGSDAGTTGTNGNGARLDKNGGRFILFAILVASITFQAGLTPPGGFFLQDDIHSGHHHVGYPVLLYNYPRRYKVFFYCNSVSFMVSTVLLLLLVNPNMYRPAIRSHALSLCSALSFVCLIGAFVAGSTQHLKTSIYIIVMVTVAVFLCLPLLLIILYAYMAMEDPAEPDTGTLRDNSFRNKIYLMTLGILVGGVTYQAGLDPPGGSWQSGSKAGHPVMHDKRSNRYLAFLYGNTTSFVASIYLMEILLFTRRIPYKTVSMAIEPLVVAQYTGFLVAYAAGSSRQWRTSAHVVGTLVISVLAYIAIHVMLSFCLKRKTQKPSETRQQHTAQG